MGFIAYVTLGILALVLDRGAMWDSCAEDYWIWMYVLLVLAIKLGKETHPIFPIIFVKRPLLQEPIVLLQPVRVKELLARIAHFLPFKVIQNVVIKRRIGAIEDGPQRHLYEI
jgi:hypothetical protein